MFIHTCFKGGFESSVSSSSVAITLEMYPDHVTRALYRTRIVGATNGFGENCPILSCEINRSGDWFLHVGFSDFQVVIFAVHALLQFECRVESDLNLAFQRHD